MTSYIQWWTNQSVLNDVVKQAERLNTLYPKERLVSIGQSPAWTVYTAGLLRKLFGAAADIDYISFSGHFMRRSGKEDDFSHFSLDEEKRPLRVHMDRYHDYLHDKKMTPAHITQHFEETGQKTVLTEMTCSAQGFASFLHAWLKSSDYDPIMVERAVTLHLLYCHSRHDQRWSIELDPSRHAYLEKQIRMQEAGYYAKKTVGLTGEYDVAADSPRLVPSFDISRGGSGTLREAGNVAVISTIQHNIRQHIAEAHLPRWEKQASLGLVPPLQPDVL